MPKGIAPLLIRDSLLQNMVYFNKTIPGIQESFLLARKAVLEKGPIPAEEAKLIYDSLKEVARTEHERLFVVMTAHAKGWSFAKDLDFYMTGDYNGVIGRNFRRTLFCLNFSTHAVLVEFFD